MLSIAEEANRIAKTYFKYENGLKTEQLASIEATMNGQDTISLMPTGMGKSATFQIPAMMSKGTAVVVSPLISLMKDQSDKLRKWKVPAARLGGDMTDAEVDRVTRRLHEYKLVYVAPERFKSVSFLRALDKTEVSMIVIDEAHMIGEQAGFRSAYAVCGKAVRNRYAHIPRIAVTATADPRVVEEIITTLGLQNPKIIAMPPVRKNIEMVSVREQAITSLALTVKNSVIEESPDGAVIVYSATRARTEEVAQTFRTAGVECAVYHAGLDPEVREKVQNEFMNGDIRCMSATCAFGMGVDKRNIRLVVHAELPISIHNWIQEIGRAGRDGLPAKAILNVTEKGIRSRKFMLRVGNPSYIMMQAVWEKYIESQPLNEPFTITSQDIVSTLFEKTKPSSFEAPFFVGPIINYMEYKGLVAYKPDKKVYSGKVENRSMVSDYVRRFGLGARVQGGTTHLTVFPNGKDVVPSLVARKAFTPAYDRPVEHFIMVRTGALWNISPDELARKEAQDYYNFNALLELAAAKDKQAVINRIFTITAKQEQKYAEQTVGSDAVPA